MDKPCIKLFSFFLLFIGLRRKVELIWINTFRCVSSLYSLHLICALYLYRFFDGKLRVFSFEKMKETIILLLQCSLLWDVSIRHLASEIQTWLKQKLYSAISETGLDLGHTSIICYIGYLLLFKKSLLESSKLFYCNRVFRDCCMVFILWNTWLNPILLYSSRASEW